MGVIKNFDTLSSTPQRKVVLSLIESAFLAISPKHIMESEFITDGLRLTIKNTEYMLSDYERIFLVGFGKGSSGICKYIEQVLGGKLTKGWDIDVVDETFQKVAYTKGTHPLPSQTNVDFTETVLAGLKGLTQKDLVLVVICGGGSALFESPHAISLPRLSAVNAELLKSGATISEMNVIRKHLSKVKGGGFAATLFPATVASLLFSDVPGNDMTVIASGPTVMDSTTKENAMEIIKKYSLKSVTEEDLQEVPHAEKYFTKVKNMIMVSNMTALVAMQEKAKETGYHATILTDRLQGEAKTIGKVLLSETRKNEILLAGGETTTKVKGNGRGGRNQTVVLSTLQFLQETDTIASFDSDGWDFTTFAGAIGDSATRTKADRLGLDPKTFLDNDNSTEFFEKTGDGIDTGRLESNVSDLFIVARI